MQRLLWGEQGKEFSPVMSSKAGKPVPERLAAARPH